MKEENEEEMFEKGQIVLEDSEKRKILLLSIIGEIEGHEAAPEKCKATKYDHVLPRLAAF